MYRNIIGPLPQLNLTYEELKKLLCDILKERGRTFDFTSFVNEIANYVKTNNLAIDSEPNTTYSGGLCQIDESRVREVLWDFIVDRYLTPGGNGHDTWPTLTITERGKRYFSREDKES